LILERKQRNEAEATAKYPVKRDEERGYVPPDFDELSPDELAEQKIAERRGASQELIWIQENVGEQPAVDPLGPEHGA
jgi:hypothetical protein